MWETAEDLREVRLLGRVGNSSHKVSGKTGPPSCTTQRLCTKSGGFAQGVCIFLMGNEDSIKDFWALKWHNKPTSSKKYLHFLSMRHEEQRRAKVEVDNSSSNHISMERECSSCFWLVLCSCFCLCSGMIKKWSCFCLKPHQLCLRVDNLWNRSFSTRDHHDIAEYQVSSQLNYQEMLFLLYNKMFFSCLPQI